MPSRLTRAFRYSCRGRRAERVDENYKNGMCQRYWWCKYSFFDYLFRSCRKLLSRKLMLNLPINFASTFISIKDFIFVRTMRNITSPKLNRSRPEKFLARKLLRIYICTKKRERKKLNDLTFVRVSGTTTSATSPGETGDTAYESTTRWLLIEPATGQRISRCPVWSSTAIELLHSSRLS